MNQKRLNENAKPDVSIRDTEPELDLSLTQVAPGGIRRLPRRAEIGLVRLGAFVVRTGLRVLIGILKLGAAIYHNLRTLPHRLKAPLQRLRHMLVQPISLQMAHADHIHKTMVAAKKKGRRAMIGAGFQSVFHYIWGENGLFINIFHYAAPIVSIAFLIGVVRYGMSLEYGLNVHYNGQNLGVITEESEFHMAAAEVQKRIAGVDGVEELVYTPKFSLTVVDGNSHYLSATQLADKLLTNSDAKLVEAYGIYLDGSFVGAVTDKAPVELALAEHLAAYQADSKATDIRYRKNVEYQQGLYLASSMQPTEDMCRTLTESARYETEYQVVEGDTIYTIAKQFQMTTEDLKALNPDIQKECTPGETLRVIKTTSLMPIQYTVQMTMTSFVRYDSVNVETSEINEGDTKVLVRGVDGETSNVVNVIYVDGAEAERVVVSSTLVKAPVTEQIGIGTYSAQPKSASTVLAGSGQFSWPVNGGYISDPFLSNRNHKGMDIAAPAGTEIYAGGAGEVVAAGWNPGGYGYLVMIDHGDGYETVYGHCSKIWVAQGQQVSRGQRIADVGSTGDSTGNHLHFEVRYNGICLNPANYLRVNVD